ncbi:MAG: hypothetical protein AB7T10_02515 [bacterium]
MRRIIGFIGLVLLFTNCVTLFHSARVLEPGETETGGSFVLSGTVAQESGNIMSGQIEQMVITTPPIALYARRGWGNGINTGAYLGFLFADFFATKQIFKESGSIPSCALTGDVGLTSVLFFNNLSIGASLDFFKSNYSGKTKANPSLKIRGAYNAWQSYNMLEGNSSTGRYGSLAIIIGNETMLKQSSFIATSLGLEVSYREIGWASGPFSVELNLSLSFFRRK